MSIPELFIRRPVATTLVMLGILIFGVVAYRMLPVNNLPNVDFPTLEVEASLPGANPDTMAAAVATPLEKQFSTVPGLDSMSSANTQGQTRITLQFALSRNIDGAAQDVQGAITQASRSLPPEMPTPPSLHKVNPADSPILFIALYSPTLPLSTVDEYAETYIGQRISTVSGVAQVQVYGAQKYAVHVQLDPQALATRQIGIDEVMSALQSGNVNMPSGILWGRHQAVTLQATGQLYDAAAYRKLIVAYRNGAPVRLGELGDVIDSVENDKTAAWYNNDSTIMLAIFRQPGTNTVQVVDDIRAMLPQLTATLPPSINLSIRTDRSVTIRDSVQDVKFTLLLALGLVILVIFLFLRNVSATAIPSLALPISIVGTFAVMYLFGYSLDDLSLMALTLSVGFVVDDAIVMLENIVRHMEHGEGVMEAALNGSGEIGFTILSMTLSLTAVFIPVLFMGGIIGRLLHEFAVTIMSAVLVSGLVSLTLTPMLCSRFLHPPQEEKHGRLFNAFEDVQTWVTELYGRWLRVVLRHKPATMTMMVFLLAGTVYLFLIIPKGFLPSDDIGQIRGRTEAIEGVSFESMVQHQKEVSKVAQQDPYVDGVMSAVGLGSSSINQGMLNLQLVPADRRPDVDQVIQELRKKMAKIPGVVVYLQNPPEVHIGGIQSNSQYQFTLQSTDTGELYNAAQDFEARMRSIPSLQDISSDLQIKNPEINVVLDRDKASALGVTAEQVEDALYSAFGQRMVSTIYTPNNEYRVILELQPQDQRDPAALSSLYIRSKSGQLVPLSAVATLTRTYGPLQVNHLGQLPAVTISFNLAPGAALGSAVSAIQDLAQRTLPPTINATFQGEAQAFQKSLVGLGILLLMAILVIYIVLGILYESFIHPITILSGLPSAGFGALLTLELFHLAAQAHWVGAQLDMQLDLYGFVGVIMLIGIVKKNAIMMIDFALDAQRNEGKSPTEAIYQGCLVRFRPITMTTMAALMGTLPIALGVGAGANSRRALGVAVVGGLIFSQFVTLFLTPVFYIYMEQARASVARVFGRRTEPAPVPLAPSNRPVGAPIARIGGAHLPPDREHSDRARDNRT
jgi:hydrophobic/amphiphilic exporter-1 (mainly G- bacteria), HAE1 family